MQELSIINSYGEFKTALDTELHNQAEGFVRTGYLLKRARDTDILKESGYVTVAEFAKGEYGLNKDTVSRYIAINDRYSENGYSEVLQDKYNGYGVAKLQEMLTLPDTIVELISPDMTKREIKEVKEEYKKEEKISDIEVLLEGEVPDQTNMTILQKVLYQYFHEQREEFIRLDNVIEGMLSKEEEIENILDIMAPSGVAVKTVRIQGIGRMMMSFRGKENAIDILNVRSNEKEEIQWQQLISEIKATFGSCGIKEWERIYGEKFEAVKQEPIIEKKQEVAPVQPKKEIESHQVSEKSPTLLRDVNQPFEKNIPHQEETSTMKEEQVEEIVDNQEEIVTDGAEHEEVEEIPGQKTINDYPEYLPDQEEEEEKKDLSGIISAANVSLSKLNTEVGNKEYKAAVSSAEHLIHYLKILIEEGEQ